MYFWYPKTKKEMIDWLFWFYNGKYSKYQIKKKNVKSWYFLLRFSGARKQSSSFTGIDNKIPDKKKKKNPMLQ